MLIDNHLFLYYTLFLEDIISIQHYSIIERSDNLYKKYYIYFRGEKG